MFEDRGCNHHATPEEIAAECAKMKAVHLASTRDAVTNPTNLILHDGEWLFRDAKCEYWRLTKISNNVVTAGWIEGNRDLAEMRDRGFWRKPTLGERLRAAADPMGRLFTED